MLAFIAGILTVFSYAPFNLWFKAPFAVATLFYVNQNVSAKSAARNGFFFGLGWFGAGISWVHVSIAQFGGLPLIASLLLMLLLVSYLAVYPTLACWLTHKLSRTNSLYSHVYSTLHFNGIPTWHTLNGFPLVKFWLHTYR